MSWFAAGAAAVGTVTSIWQGRQQAKAAARQESAQIRGQSEAESRAIIKDRLNQTIRNSYHAAMLQSQFALQKQKAAQRGADISAAHLAAQGENAANQAAAGNEGASATAVSADISTRAEAAASQNQLELQQLASNYNNELYMISVNTQVGSPDGVRDYHSTGNYGSEWRRAAGVQILSGLAQFGLGYAQRRMQLGPGVTPPPVENRGTGFRATQADLAGSGPASRGVGFKARGGVGLRR